MTARRERKGDHVVMRGGGATCLHCGDHQEITLPQLMESVAAVLRAFAKVHADCAPRSTASLPEKAPLNALLSSAGRDG